MGICYIVGAGEFSGNISPRDGDFVIAADGGYKALTSHGVRVDLLIGDLDSLGEEPSGVELLRYPTVKDDTDSFLAYKEGAKRGYEEFRLYGCTGGREDHTFANYTLLLYARRQGHRATMYGDGSLSFVIKNEAASILGEADKYFSVFAIGGEARGVSIKGARYNAEGINLAVDFPLGVSNEFSLGEVTVSVNDGELIIMAQTEHAPRFLK